MGTYVYSHKARKHNFDVELQNGEKVRVGVLKFMCKPYWDSWETALDLHKNPYNSKGERRKVSQAFFSEFEKDTVRKYRSMLTNLERNAEPTDYVVFETDDEQKESRTLHKVNMKLNEWYYDTWDGEQMTAVGIVVKEKGRFRCVDVRMTLGCGTQTEGMI